MVPFILPQPFNKSNHHKIMNGEMKPADVRPADKVCFVLLSYQHNKIELKVDKIACQDSKAKLKCTRMVHSYNNHYKMD